MTIVQIAHITEIPGPVQSLANYYEKKGINFYKIYHPLDSTRIKYSILAKNLSILEKKEINTHAPIRYILDFFLSVLWLKKINNPVDKAIGMNCFDTLPLILFKKTLKIKEIIFFNTDFSRKRFSNNIFNIIYITIDRFCAKNADKVCCNTQKTINARLKEGVDPKKIIYTPNGIFLKDLGEINYLKKKFIKKLLFIGHLSKEHGIQHIIDQLPHININLAIIGSGNYAEELKRKVRELKLDNRIEFLGAKSHQETIEYLKNFSGFGIAPYLSSNDWVLYCDPVKVKEYLACFIPVIISDIPEIANFIKKNKIGFVYKNTESLRKTLCTIEQFDEKKYKEILERIKKVYHGFDLDLIYNKI